MEVETMQKTMELALAYKEQTIALRREFHQNPEPSGEEFETCRRVVEELEKLGLSPRVVCGTGVVADIEGPAPGKTIALRADMDALSVQELHPDLPYRSRRDGLMHACGHDGHTATLLTAARILCACREQIRGTVRLLFQPAEEIGVGAKQMIEAGLLDGVDATFAIHLWSGVPSGTVSVEAGPRMAAANYFQYKILGKPGHGGLPQQGVDAGLAAAAVVLNLQSLVSREYTPLQPLVITVGQIHSGTR
ncbi:MAG: amidohydrolase, partial [Clostridia bacterium]|nr:amidohydrolase [Clostridia bacterium]